MVQSTFTVVFVHVDFCIIIIAVSIRMCGQFYYRRKGLKSIILIVINSIEIVLIVRSTSGLLFRICTASLI